MKKLTIILLTTLSLFAADSQIDLRIDTDPNHLDSKTSFNVTSTTSAITRSGNHAALFTPEMSFYANGGVDFSVASTHRHRLFGVVFGHTVFFDRTNISSMDFDQLGTGIDIQTKQFDFRVNYYHPLSQLFSLSGPNYSSEIKSCKWADSEIFFKTKWFGVGTGPMYNVDFNAWALHSRLVIPMDKFSLNFGAICGGGEYGQSQAIFSISFHLFKPNKVNALTVPPCHVQKSNIYYGHTYAIEAEELKKPSIKKNTGYQQKVTNYIEQTEEEITLGQKEGV